MRGIIEDGTIAKNKEQAVEYAKRLLDSHIEGGADPNTEYVYVMHPDNELIWFTVGYCERKGVSNHIQIKGGYKTPEQVERLERFRAMMHERMAEKGLI